MPPEALGFVSRRRIFNGFVGFFGVLAVGGFIIDRRIVGRTSLSARFELRFFRVSEPFFLGLLVGFGVQLREPYRFIRVGDARLDLLPAEIRWPA